MKVTIDLKDPDGVYESIHRAARESADAVKNIDEEERDSLVDSRAESIKESLGKWIKWGEYVSIEFDLDAGTATVKQAS